MDSVLVLIAAPASGAITSRIAMAFMGHWLNEGDALEIPATHEVEARRLCAGLPIDINRVPSANRRKKVLLADMDSDRKSVV